MDVFDFNVKLRIPELMYQVYPKILPHMKRFMSLYKCEERLTPEPVEKTIERMEQAGVKKAILRGARTEDNPLIFDLCRQDPDRFYGFAGIQTNVLTPTQAFRDLEVAYKDYGFYGLSLGPMFSGVYINDARNYPLFVLTEAMGKILIAHCAFHLNLQHPYDLGDPKYLDRVALDFPDMKIVMGHAAQGFGTLAISMAQRHPNVYLDFSGLFPQVIRPETIFAINTFLRKKAFFGTTYPVCDFTLIEQWKAVINEKNHADFFFNNTARLLGLMD